MSIPVPSTWAILPLKQFSDAKRRLSDTLDAQERELLMLAMVRDVLAALAACADLAGILIVSRADEAGVLAREFGAEWLRETAGADLSQAVLEAAAHVERQHGARTALVVPGDVPLVSADDVHALLKGHSDVTLVSDGEGVGTNCIVVSPPTRLQFAFGGASFPRHVEAARRSGAEARIVTSPTLALDVDRPEDLKALIERLPAPHSRTYLDGSGIASRVGGPHNTPSSSARN